MPVNLQLVQEANTNKPSESGDELNESRGLKKAKLHILSGMDLFKVEWSIYYCYSMQWSLFDRSINVVFLVR